jgi:3-deoxy-D-arabino-heptulosonate 7-phosphate (DAHP) synthase
MVWILIIRIREFGVAFQTDELTGLHSVSIADLINHAAMGAGPQESDTHIHTFSRSEGRGIHDGSLFIAR